MPVLPCRGILRLPGAIHAATRSRSPTRAFGAQVDAILQADESLRHSLSEITVPTLVIVGSQDVLTPMADAEEIAEVIPGALLAVVRGGAHGFMFEHAKVFNETVRGFLDTVSAEAPGAVRRLPAA